jgi:hypothetical protein
LFLTLALFAGLNHATAQNIYTDNFSEGINSANWTSFGTSPNALGTSSGSLQAIGPGEAGFFNAGLQLNMNAVGGNTVGDFTTSLDFLFTGETGNVVVFQALFEDGSTLNEYYMGSFPNYIFALNGSDPSVTSGNISVAGNSEIFSIARSGSIVTAYFSGTPFFTITDSSALTGIDLNYASPDGSLQPGNVLATFNRVTLDSTPAPEPSACDLIVLSSLIWFCYASRRLKVRAGIKSQN